MPIYRFVSRFVSGAALLALLTFVPGPAEAGSTLSLRARAPARTQRTLPARLVESLKSSADWSLEQAEKIKEFFLAKFGRALPVSAIGQTAVHDHMKFDHREAMDVALSPDSKEGRALIGYLRETGIPFMAFRRKIAGVATGPHIHIGNPSPRLAPGREIAAGEEEKQEAKAEGAPEAPAGH
ncbi:MAG TPA: hypothetical protein VGA73_00370 [Candidatus Binatia bacterium]